MSDGEVMETAEIEIDDQDVQSVWEGFWHPIVGDDLEQIKMELFDYYHTMTSVAVVYDHITGGVISKPLTCPDVVIGMVEERYDKIIREDVAEEAEPA